MTNTDATNHQLKRTLKPRHLTMLALGGSIGTGLFVASGAAISQAGPGGALAAYLVIGVMVLLSDDGVGRTCRLFPGKRHLCRLRRTVCGSGLRVRPNEALIRF